jgi:4-phytase / acid phosphatase
VKNNPAARTFTLWMMACGLSTGLFAAPELRYVAIMSRHGVRSPTWESARLNQYSADSWPDWGVPPGYLTPHGRESIRILGSYYREWLVKERLLASKGCADNRRITIWADIDERTLETGRAFAESLAPGCGLAIQFRPGSGADPLFSGVSTTDPQRTTDAIQRRLKADPQPPIAAHRSAFDTLEFILTGGRRASTPLIESPEGIEPLSLSSTLSENLLLEYTNGLQGSALGWGRLTKENLFRVLELHRAYADLTRRTPEIARARGSNLLAHVLASLQQAVSGRAAPGALGPPSTALLMLSGHDTNLSNLSGMLDLSWTLPGYQPDETPPGGALLFLLWRDTADGRFSVELRFLAPTLDQMRDATPLSIAAPPSSQAVSAGHCARLCSWSEFQRIAQNAIDRSQTDFVP